MKIEMQEKKIVATQIQKYQTREYEEDGNALMVEVKAIVKPKESTSNGFQSQTGSRKVFVQKSLIMRYKLAFVNNRIFKYLNRCPKKLTLFRTSLPGHFFKLPHAKRSQLKIFWGHLDSNTLGGFQWCAPLP